MSDLARVLLDAHQFILAVILLAAGYIRGRHNERRHLQELARRERDLRDVLVFATRYPPTSMGVLDPVLVTGSVALAADSFKMFVAGLRKLVGGQFDAYGTLISRARREATLRLKEAAKAAGCRMVFNVRLETTQINNGARGGSTSVEVLAYGTAFAPARGSVADSPHHFQPGPPPADVTAFDLSANPASRKVLWGLGIGTIYYLAEMLGMREYAYVDEAPRALLAALLVFTLLGAGAFLRKRAVPLAETIALSGLCGVVAIAVGYVAALRVNAATDFSGPREVVYVLQRDLSLHATDPAMPDLRFPKDQAYWSSQPRHSRHRFTLSRGALGVWQFREEPYLDRLRAYYQKHS